MPVVCSIGTTDPWNAAGLGLDIRLLSELGVRAVTIVAAVSAQDDRGIRALAPIDSATIEAQWRSLANIQIDAIRVGALAGAPAVETVARILGEVSLPVVYDPVLGPSGGGAFLDAAAIAAVREQLLSHVTICTPNLAEAAALSGNPVRDVPEMENAARAILARGARAVLVTGGHLSGDPLDVLVTSDSTTRTYRETRIAAEVRGTGCTLAIALSAELAQGAQLVAAVERARVYVRRKITEAIRVGGFLVVE
jgi:hydroxymethylpyrimidine kinase/phosphomethylpyrimidine kinase